MKNPEKFNEPEEKEKEKVEFMGWRETMQRKIDGNRVLSGENHNKFLNNVDPYSPYLTIDIRQFDGRDSKIHTRILYMDSSFSDKQHAYHIIQGKTLQAHIKYNGPASSDFNHWYDQCSDKCVDRKNASYHFHPIWCAPGQNSDGLTTFWTIYQPRIYYVPKKKESFEEFLCEYVK